MNPEWTKKFIELVKSGAPIKAYQKKLGLNKEGLQYHLGRLAEYEAQLQEKPKAKPPTTKELSNKKKVAKTDSLIKSATPSWRETAKKIKKRLDDKVVEYEEVVEDEQDEKDNAS